MTHPSQAKGRATTGAVTALAALPIALIAGPASAQMVNSADTARRGHDLATVACSNCHQVAIEQRGAPLRAPPAALYVEKAAY
jgi:mono/diheme cytochrome c family protein